MYITLTLTIVQGVRLKVLGRRMVDFHSVLYVADT
jgi:hypothetical protein